MQTAWHDRKSVLRDREKLVAEENDQLQKKARYTDRMIRKKKPQRSESRDILEASMEEVTFFEINRWQQQQDGLTEKSFMGNLSGIVGRTVMPTSSDMKRLKDWY